MVVILIVAAVVSGLLGDWKDAIAILAIVVLNAVLGFTQEFRAERAMAALKQLAVPTVKVRRGGHVLEISARDLVPGDVVLLEAGALVPADGRLLESINLRTKQPESASYERSDVCPIAACSCIVENVVAFEIARAMVDKFGGDSLAEMQARWKLFHDMAREKLEG